MSEDKKNIRIDNGVEIIDAEPKKKKEIKPEIRFKNDEVVVEAEFEEVIENKVATKLPNKVGKGVSEPVEKRPSENLEQGNSKLPAVDQLVQAKKQMKEKMKDVNKETLLDNHIDTLLQLSEIKQQLREMKIEMHKLSNKVSESLEVEHYASESKISFASKALNYAKEKTASFFKGALMVGAGLGIAAVAKGAELGEKAIEKGKDMGEDIKLATKKNYHSRFQKSRAFLSSAKDLVLKPAAKFTAKKFKEAEKKVDLINDKVKINLDKQGLSKDTTKNYAAMFIAVASEEAGKKLYQVSGMKKVVDTTVESAKKVKNAYDVANDSFNSNVQANKAKATSVEQKIEAKKEAKKQKAL